MLNRIIETKHQKIQIIQKLQYGHAGTVWDGALVLIYYFIKQQQKYQKIFFNNTILQLGAGTGIVGLLTYLFKPKNLILTDFEDNLKIIEENINHNFKNRQNIFINSLKWGQQQSMKKLDRFKIDIIIGSQLAYDKQNTFLLLQTLDRFQKLNNKLVVIISYQKYLKNQIHLGNLSKNRKNWKITQVSSKDMDEDYQDNSIGIIIMQSNQSFI